MQIKKNAPALMSPALEKATAVHALIIIDKMMKCLAVYLHQRQSVPMTVQLKILFAANPVIVKVNHRLAAQKKKILLCCNGRC